MGSAGHYWNDGDGARVFANVDLVNENLAEVARDLESFGYEVDLQDEAVHTKVGGEQNPFTVLLTIDKARNALVITCQLAKLGDIGEDSVPAFTIAALDANSRINPFAFATLI